LNSFCINSQSFSSEELASAAITGYCRNAVRIIYISHARRLPVIGFHSQLTEYAITPY